MKKINIFIGSACMLLFAACSQEEVFTAPQEDNQGKLIEISVSKPDLTGSRMSYEDAAQDKLPGIFRWEATDKLVVVGFDDGQHYKGHRLFTTESGKIDEEGRKATFTGMGIKDATNFKLYYRKGDSSNPKNPTIDGTLLPSGEGTPTVSGTGAATYTYTGQVQNGSGNTDHLKNYLHLEGDAPTKESLTWGVNLSMKNALFRITLNGWPDGLTNGLSNVKTLTWESYKSDGSDRQTMTLDFQTAISDFTSPVVAYISFDPTTMHLQDARSYLIVKLTDTAGKTEMARARSSQVVDYEGGHRYRINIPNANNETFTWLKQGNHEIWFKTENNETPTFTTLPGNGLKAPERVVGTDYWTITSTSDTPAEIAAIPEGLFNSKKQPAIKATEVVLPSTITSIGDNAFLGCDKLTQINLPNGLKTIGDQAFHGCAQLPATMEIPSSVTSIGKSAFEGGTSVETLTLQEGLVSIGESAFEGFTNLKGVIDIPSSVTTIGKKVFKDCQNISGFTGNDYVKEGAYLTNNAGSDTGSDNTSDLVAFAPREGTEPHTSNRTEANIPEGITGINNAVFHDCRYLETIIIPSTLKHVSEAGGSTPDDEAKDAPFEGCVGVKKMIIKPGHILGKANADNLIKGLKTTEIDLYINRDWLVDGSEYKPGSTADGPMWAGKTWKTIYLVNGDGTTGIEKLPNYEDIL